MKLKWIIIIGLVLVAGLVAVKATTSINNLKEKANNLVIKKLDLSKTEDGVYDGECNLDIVYARVRVTIIDHKIIGVEILEHKKGLGGKAEKITETVVKNQSLDVDIVSGATVSSKALLKAIENAVGLL